MTTPDENGWQSMETAPRDGTIVNVVARYPDATAGFPTYAGFAKWMGCWVEYSRHPPEPVVPLVWRLVVSGRNSPRPEPDMRPTDAQIEAAFERAWYAVHRCTILTTLRREWLQWARRAA